METSISPENNKPAFVSEKFYALGELKLTNKKYFFKRTDSD